MRYWIDTEFIDTGSIIDLISIGIVCEDGRELYLQSCEFHHRNASDWVRENVLRSLVTCPHTEHYRSHEIAGLYRADRAYHAKFGGQCTESSPDKGLIGAHADCLWRTREQITNELRSFFNPSDTMEWWGWCAAYDYVAICQLFGTMMDLPAGWPHYMKDIQYPLDQDHITDDQLPPQEGNVHNALADARYIKRLWEEFG